MNSSLDDSSMDSNATGSNGRSRAGLKDTLKKDGLERVENGKRAAAEQMEDVADAIDVASSHLDHSQPNLAAYASRLADGVAGVAKRLREGSIEELTRDARQLANRNPGMFLLGSAALGIVVARFFKASGETSSAADSGEEAGWASDSEEMSTSQSTADDRDDNEPLLSDEPDVQSSGEYRPGRAADGPAPYAAPTTGG